MYQFKIDTNGKKYLPYVSPAVEKYIGIPAKVVMNDVEKWFDLTHPSDLPSLEKSILDSLTNLSTWNWEGRFIRHDGGIVWLRGTSKPERMEDGSTLWNGLFIDVSERRSQEDQLRRTQKMDALGKLTGGIAHDYNNILGIILGYAEQINENISDTDKIEKYSKSIIHSAKRGSILAKKLLKFSRYQQPSVTTLNINNLLHEQQHMLEKSITASHTLTLDLADHLWIVELDAGDLEDAIINLSINALHAMSLGGELTIKTSNERINTLDAEHLNLNSGDYVLLSITDTGCGMDDATKDRLFDPFYTTKGEQGTGLGLSQVYGFVDRSRGAIKVYSELEHGSRFSLYFPRSEKSISKIDNSTKNTTQNITGNETLLVVDDEIDLTNLAYEILTTKGYHVLTANSGRQALDLLKKEKVDLMISDVIMPNMDGYQLAEQVRQHYPSIKLQMASGFSDERHNEKVDSDLHNNILQKPYSSKTLLSRVRHLLDEADTSNELSNRTILVLDDDEDIQALYEINFQKLGCHLISAFNGEEAIYLYKDALETDSPVDIMIVDISIPGGMGGIDVTNEVRNFHPHAKIIVSSGNSEGPEMINPKNFGFDGALEKDFDFIKIEKILKQVLNHK